MVVAILLMATCEWVSNTYPTCPSLEDSLPKGKLILHESRIGIGL